ncbi:hypothetical protein NKH77_19350 [Streptomyces sp. M19]
MLPHALHGMGGVGKSQLALEYVYRNAARYDMVWWIPAERPTQISQALVELSQRMHLPVTPEAITAVPAVLEALRTGSPTETGCWCTTTRKARKPYRSSSRAAPRAAPPVPYWSPRAIRSGTRSPIRWKSTCSTGARASNCSGAAIRTSPWPRPTNSPTYWAICRSRSSRRRRGGPRRACPRRSTCGCSRRRRPS